MHLRICAPMSDRAIYLDSSAFAKLVMVEPESAALSSHLRSWTVRVSAALLRTEVLRAAMRTSQDHVARARQQLRHVALIEIDRDLLDRAGTLAPPEVRSLDAIHLAAALSLGDDLAEIVTYDDRMIVAAKAHGLAVSCPR
jgi:predicted nucleic acid-binding protein